MGFEPGLLFQGITFGLIKQVVRSEDETAVQVSTRPNKIRLRVITSQGEVLMTVYGDDCDDAAGQLVLACLQRLGADRLRELHSTPLKKLTPLAVM